MNPNLDFPVKRLVEEVAVDNESKSPKKAKRPREEFNEHAAGMVESPTVDDSSPLVLQNKDDGSSAKKDGDVKEVSTPKEEYDSSESEEEYNAVFDDDDVYGYCEGCVDDKVCKYCGNLNGRPVSEEQYCAILNGSPVSEEQSSSGM